MSTLFRAPILMGLLSSVKVTEGSDKGSGKGRPGSLSSAGEEQ